MKKVTALFDTVLTFVALFVLACIVAGYFLHATVAVVATALTLSLTVLFFTGRHSVRRAAKQADKKTTEEKRNKFLFSPPSYAFDFAMRAVTRKCPAARERDGLIVAAKTAFCVCLTPDRVRTAFLAERYATAAALAVKRLVFLSAYGAEADAEDTASRLTDPATEIWDWDKTCDFFTKLGCPPTETLALPKRKRRGKILSEALSRAHARKYLFAALVTLLFARFLPYSVLYVTIAAVSLTLSLVCRFDVATRLRNKRKP